MNRELLKQCLDALDRLSESNQVEYSDIKLIEALKQELAKPDPEPIWYHCVGKYGEHRFYDNVEEQPEGSTPLYAAPTEPNCRFPTCHSQEYQDKLAQEIVTDWSAA